MRTEPDKTGRTDKPPRKAALIEGCRWTPAELRAFSAGTHSSIQDRLGAHPTQVRGVDGYSFSVWAPHAQSVSVIGAFNGWSSADSPLVRLAPNGVWWGFVAGIGAGELYKYHIVSRTAGYRVDKSDPCAIRAQLAPDTASITWRYEYRWEDAAWMETRRDRQAHDRPLSIYELHLGSWRRDDPADLPAYRDLVEPLIEHLERTGFTHVELMPPTEHPYYGSWGYQTTGYFAATSRYGTPEDLMFLIDRLHRAGIGVLIDWVPSHFANDGHALTYFDGDYEYEYGDPRVGYHQDWNSYIFNYGSNEVRSFLISSALHWLRDFHIDGIRVDAVASMLYLDYSRKDGEWVANKYGGRENLEAIAFLRQLNDTAHREHPDVLMIAEESTAWPLVTRPPEVGGLGFDMKWDMGWMHDSLDYMQHDPVFRKYHHNLLSFRGMYAFSENFLLAFSHDEVVHGKRSLLDKMPGDAWQKHANLRALLGLMFGQPGKKLLFMGSEFGQWREWSHERQLDWELLEHPSHAGLQRWVGDLNRCYRSEPALHCKDFDPDGFEWIDCNDADHSVLSFVRRGRPDDAAILVVCNLTPVPRHNYRTGVPIAGRWSEILNSDAEIYGGSGLGNLGAAESVPIGYHDRAQSVCLTLPPLSTLFLRIDRTESVAPGAVTVTDSR